MQPFTSRSNRQAILFVIGAVACFSALDVMSKYLGHIVSVAVALWVRYAAQVVMTAAVVLPQRGTALFRTRRPGLQILRGVLMVTSSGLAFISLRTVPVAEFSAILMLIPLVITVVAAIWLKEQVSVWRWVLMAGGFVGALVVIRPGSSEFHWAMLIPLLLVGFTTTFQMLGGHLARYDDSSTTHFYTGLVALIVASIALPFDMLWPDSAWFWLILGLLGVFSNLGHHLLVVGYGRARPGVVAPFIYFQVVFAVFGGWLVFAQVPDGWSLLGIAIIVGCGLVGNWLRSRQDAAR